MKKIRSMTEADFLKLFFACFSAAFLIAAVCMPDRGTMFTGLWQILSQPSKLTSNYFAIGADRPWAQPPQRKQFYPA